MTTPPQSRAAIGIDVGGTKVLGVTVSSGRQLIDEQRVPTPRDSDELVMAIADLVRSLDSGDGTTAVPVGVGAPGIVDQDGVVRFSPNLPGAGGVELRRQLTAELGGRRVLVDNDANCAGWAEAKAESAKH